jgi:S1-C subfamily serine protease
VLVVSVEKDSPADEAGVKGGFKPLDVNGKKIMVGGDIVTAVNGASIENVQDLRNQVLRADPGDELKLSILRDGATQEITVTLGERPVQ